MPKTINIIARSNGVGLDSDVSLLTKSLETAGYEITFSHCRSKKFYHKWFTKKNQYDLNIFLERVFPIWFNSAKKNILIPNQERFPKRHISRLKKINSILCKSNHATSIFKKLGAHTLYTGFTSKDILRENSNKDYNQFLHLAGSSTLKGTNIILKLWEKHPEWPTLTLLQHQHNAPESVPQNVNLITKHLSDTELTQLTNKIGIHLCPSLSEGWGHYIVEAMSTEAVVLTTDAPPMNELVSPTHGITVPYSNSQPRHLGTNYFINELKLEQEIEKLILMKPDKKQAIGKLARNWFLKNHSQFQKKLVLAINQITDQ